MASSIGTTLGEVKDAFKRLGVFQLVDTNEPKAAPGKGYTAAIFLASMSLIPEASGLNSATGLYVFTVRIYTDMLAEPVGDIDPGILAVIDKVNDALAGDFDLGATVRNVDFFGAHGAAYGWQAGYVEVGGKMQRIVDGTLPLVVNDVMAFTA